MKKNKIISGLLLFFTLLFLWVSLGKQHTFSQVRGTSSELTYQALDESSEKVIILYHKNCNTCQEYQNDIIKNIELYLSSSKKYYIDLDNDKDQYQLLRKYLADSDIFEGAKTPFYIIMKGNRVKYYGRVSSSSSLQRFISSLKSLNKY